MTESEKNEVILSKLVLARFALAGALVALSIAEVLGVTTDVRSQIFASGFGAATVFTLKLVHII